VVGNLALNILTNYFNILADTDKRIPPRHAAPARLTPEPCGSPPALPNGDPHTHLGPAAPRRKSAPARSATRGQPSDSGHSGLRTRASTKASAAGPHENMPAPGRGTDRLTCPPGRPQVQRTTRERAPCPLLRDQRAGYIRKIV
jgi:hypothetical protein